MRARTRSGADLLDLAPVGHLTTDEAGVIASANPEFLRLVGRTEDEVVGRLPLDDLLTLAGRIYVETHLLPVLQEQEVVREVEVDLLRPDGAYAPVLLNARRLGDAGSRAMQIVMLGATERHRYEENLRQASRTAEAARAEAAALAQTLSRTLIPPAPPSVPHLDIAAAYRPAGDGREVGGDFYDVFQVSETGWVVVLGDVSGKGVHAATVTSLVRHTVRTLAIDHPDPAELLHGVDAVLTREDTDHYCTLVVVRMDYVDGGWDLRISLAGHPPALLRSPDGTVTELGTPGSPAGLMPDPSFSCVRHRMDQGLLTVYTDGVTEARGVAGMYGEDRLYGLVEQLPHDAQAQVDGIVASALAYQDGLPADDIAIVSFSPLA